MKRLIFMSALILGMLPMLSAQEVSMEKEITNADYERILESQLKIDFRNKAYKSMALTEDEIIAFDPIFNKYIEKKRELLQQKFDLTDEYKKEITEDDTAEDEKEETAGFIENYWELDIQEMELKKDFFTQFGEVVSTDQAINFFLLEEDMQSDMERPNVIRVVPMIMEFERVPTATEQQKWETPKKEGMKEGDNDSSMKVDTTMDKTQTRNWTDEKMAATGSTITTTENKAWTDSEKSDKKEDYLTEKSVATNKTDDKATDDKVTTYSKWVKEAKGGVALDHQYTHDGLIHLVAAVWSVADANGMDVSAWKTKKDEVKKMAAQLQVDPLSTDHADITKEAFVMIADMIETIQTKTNDSNVKAISQSVVTAANAIDPDELLTKQAEKIYTFFDQANEAVSKMSSAAAKKASAYNQNK